MMTPTSSLLIPLGGGALIGLAVAALLLFNGRLAGISGIVGGLVDPSEERGDWGWRALFVFGLVLGGLVARAVSPEALGAVPTSLPLLAGAGVLVGFGTRLGGGCTSGHGICGTSRLSPRSLVATSTFMVVAGLVVFLVHRVAS
jgi:uncharacterized membrane protein YedE/YeeE